MIRLPRACTRRSVESKHGGLEASEVVLALLRDVSLRLIVQDTGNESKGGTPTHTSALAVSVIATPSLVVLHILHFVVLGACTGNTRELYIRSAQCQGVVVRHLGERASFVQCDVAHHELAWMALH